MSVAWPGSLPQYLNSDGFSYKTGSSIIESQNDIGPVKRRRVTTKPIDTITASMDITKSQIEIMRNYFDVTLNAGLTSFIFNHPFTGLPTEFRFSSEPIYTPIGGEQFTMTVQWETVP